MALLSAVSSLLSVYTAVFLRLFVYTDMYLDVQAPLV